MSKIAILFSHPVIADNPENVICYYEGLAKELSAEGNSVKLLNMRALWGGLQVSRAAQALKEFAPDLILTFNNTISESIIKATNCPIALCDADTVAFFADRHLISKYLDRYYMITFYEGISSDYEQLGFGKDRICTIKQATSIRHEALEQDKNISFLGSRFCNYSRAIGEAIQKDKNRTIFKAIEHSLRTNDYDYEGILQRYCPDAGLQLGNAYHLFDQRGYILSSLLDLGLNLYGVDWHDLFDANTALAAAYDTRPVFSLKHNQDLYNSSKINISISHPQCKGVYYPWRVYDIMASNGLLITSRSDLLAQQTKGYVSIPMFESPFEAREVCKKYLAEDNLRADIIAASQEFIEKNGRWKDNFIMMEQFLGVSLTRKAEHPDDCPAPVETVKLKYKKRSYTSNTFIWSSLLVLSTIPFAKRLIPKHIKNRIYNYMRRLEQYYEL